MHRFTFLGLLAIAGILAACGGNAAAPAASAPTSTAASASPATSAKPAGSAVASAKPAASAAAASPAASGLTKVSLGLLASSSDGGILIALDKGYFKDEGIDLQTQRFNTMVDMVAPVGAGQLDIATGAPSAGLYNALGRGVDVKIVADKGNAPSEQWDFTGLVLRKDLVDSGKVKDYKDLKGLTLVTSGKGNSPEVALATALKKGGLTLKDINYQNMGFPDMVTAMANKGIDGGIVIEPFLSSIVSAGTGVKWKSNLEIMGHNQQIAVIAYGQRVYSNQDLARRWMLAYIKGVRDYNDAFGPKKKGYEEVVSILTKETTVKNPQIFAQMTPAGIDPNGKLDVSSMQEDINYYRESGQLQQQVDLKNVIDTSFQEYAVQQLGPYQP
jgi:NitT/TauT family transport system substrate-binding protein